MTDQTEDQQFASYMRAHFRGVKVPDPPEPSTPPATTAGSTPVVPTVHNGVREMAPDGDDQWFVAYMRQNFPATVPVRRT